MNFKTLSNLTKSLKQIPTKSPDFLKAAFTQLPNTRNLLMGSSLAAGLYYIFHHYHPEKTLIKVFHAESQRTKDLASSLKSLEGKHYRPNPLLAHPMLQFTFAKQGAEYPVNYKRQIIQLNDGGQVALDWSDPMKKSEFQEKNEQFLSDKFYRYTPPEDRKIMMIVHGLTGGSDTGYVQFLVEQANKRGYRAVVLNGRGVNQPLTSPKPFHGGKIEDIDVAFQRVRSQYPKAPITMVGLSLGGNQLMRFLATKGKDNGVVAAAALAVPFNFEHCTDAVENTVIEKFFLKRYIDQHVMPHLNTYKNIKETHGIDLKDVIGSKGLREFHSKFSVKLYNHKDVKEYFSSALIEDQHIEGINVPFLIINARDDPIAVHHSIPVDKLKENPNIIFAETQHGSHLCWFTGVMPKRWYGTPTLEFLDNVLEENEKFEEDESKFDSKYLQQAAWDAYEKIKLRLFYEEQKQQSEVENEKIKN